jgi:hypothetical protein
MTKFAAKQLNNTIVFTKEEQPQGVPLFCFMNFLIGIDEGFVRANF